MASRAEEAVAINAEPWIVDIAKRGAEWERMRAAGGWNGDRLVEEMRAYIRMGALALRGTRIEPANHTLAAALGKSVEELEQLPEEQFAHSWFCSGLPRVNVGHKLAASFCSTRVPSDCSPKVVPPWAAFVVDVPEGLLVFRGMPVKHIYSPDCGDLEGARWVFSVVCTKDFRPGVEYTCNLSGKMSTAADIADQAETWISKGGVDERVAGMAMRLVLGVVLELNNHRPTAIRTAGTSPVRRNRRGDPVCTMVRLTRDVKVDCRQAVRDYIRGASDRKLSVQTLVRGHWKMQPHGPNAGERKFIHVEPYWRGPEDAPIALKNHVLGETKETR